MAKKTKPKFVTLQQVSTIAMTTGGEKTHPVILDTCLVVKRWVGFGWVTENPADADDMKRYPVLKREE